MTVALIGSWIPLSTLLSPRSAVPDLNRPLLHTRQQCDRRYSTVRCDVDLGAVTVWPAALVPDNCASVVAVRIWNSTLSNPMGFGTTAPFPSVTRAVMVGLCPPELATYAGPDEVTVIPPGRPEEPPATVIVNWELTVCPLPSGSVVATVSTAVPGVFPACTKTVATPPGAVTARLPLSV